MSKVELYGIEKSVSRNGGLRTERISDSWCTMRYTSSTSRTLLATFSDQKLAEAYVRASILKSWNPGSMNHKFRISSLLRCYDDFEILPYVNNEVPHDPVI